jgi:ABC-type sugar transport system ATPase subunit
MIGVRGLSIRQGGFALTDVTFTVATGSYAVLTGPTGCGKTTLLECLTGLRTPTAGTITLAGRDLTNLPPAARSVGYVPQDAAVFTNQTVWENLAFALTVRKWPKAEIEKRVSELAERLGLTGMLKRRAVGLSGGEAQRVALGRALAFRPPVLLLDEPLNALDQATAERLIEVLKSLRDTTVLHVTHNAGEVDHLAGVRLRFDGGVVKPT